MEKEENKITFLAVNMIPHLGNLKTINFKTTRANERVQ